MRTPVWGLSGGVVLMLLAGVLIASRQDRTQQTAAVGVVTPSAMDTHAAGSGSHVGDALSPTPPQAMSVERPRPVLHSAAEPMPSPVVADPAAVPSAQIFGHDHPTLITDLPPGAFRDAVTALDADVQIKVLAQLDTLAIPKADIASLHVGPGGKLFYVCRAAQAAAAETAQAPVVAGAAGVAVSPSPLNLHSRPGSAKVLYLAFHGPDISGTAWNASDSITTYRCRAWSADTDETTFTTAELATIEEIWKRVAESFAPYDIDVTTVQPSAWTATTGYAVITPTIGRDNGILPHDGSGGVAYVDVFGETPGYAYGTPGCYSPHWVTAYTGGSTMYMATTIAHEFGHNLGLSHDAATLPSVTGYYGNHAAWPGSSRKWGPVMGGGTINDLGHWSRGEYYGANNPQDDLQIMANKLAYRPADRGATRATASALNFSATDLISDSGVIERSGSADYFQFSGRPGRLSVTAQPFQGTLSTQWGATLDPEIQLLDSAGALLVRNDDPAGTGAVITYDLPATATYYLRVAPTAATVGNPTQAGPTGFTTYGVLGSYTLTGTLASPASPSLRVTGNGNVIPAGTTTAQVATGSDFGTLLRTESASRTFVLQNIGGQSLNLTGARVVGTSGFVLGSIANPVLAAGGQLDLTVSFPATTTTGLYQDTLSIPAGGAAPAFTCALAVRVVVAPLVVDAVTPFAEFPGNPVTLTGSQLTGATVSCNGALATVFSASATSMTILMPVTTAGATTLEVSGPNGTASVPFTVCGIPIFTAANPQVVAVSGGTQVTFSGAWLTNAAITIGGTSVTVLSTSPDAVVCTVPALAAGIYDVQVSGSGVAACPSRANSTATALLTVVATPALAAVLPASGPVAGGNQVTLTGTNLLGATMLFDGQPATVVSGTAISALVTVPSHAAGSVQVVARISDFVSGGVAYSYRPAPQITSIAPLSLPLTGGTLTLIGTAFEGAVVSLNGTVLPASASSSTAVTVQVPAQTTAGIYAVQLQTPGGQATGSVSVTVAPVTDADANSQSGGGSGCGAGGGLAIVLLAGLGLWGVRRERG